MTGIADMHGTLRERFDSKYMPVTESGCWIWIGAVRGNYGSIVHDGGLISAHRLSYELHRGPIPDNLNVCHRCDVSYCVNPAHLFLGTAKDNVTDCVKKRRNVRGAGHGLSKLTSDDVTSIRRLSAAGHSVRKLGKMFKVHYSTISDIARGLSYKD
jgi:hypothetical protein